MENHQYFENIDELVNDENKIVTYKELSEKFDIHVNHAKRILEDYLNSGEKKKITSCYIVAGRIQNDINDIPATKIVIVPERHLQVVKNAFKEVTSCHVYSVQKFLVKDGGTIYMNEAVSTLPRKFKYAIKNDRIVISKKKKSEKKENIVHVKSEPLSDVSRDQKKIVVPKKDTNPLATAFSKTASVATKTELEIKNMINKPAGKKAPAGRKTTSKSSSTLLSAFMNKGAAVRKTNVQAKVEEPLPPATEDEPVKESMWSSSEESDEEMKKPAKKKRRRIQQMSDSESEEETKQPSPAVSASPKEEVIDSEMDEDPIPPTPETRIRSQYKLITRTYQDEDGFFVTKKEKELVQEEVTDAEDPLPPPQKKKMEKPSPENATTKKKQSSLTFFFKKK